MSRPNILLFMSDNQPASMLGSYGNDELRSPHLDTLAAKSARFAEAYCVNAMCSPCCASVLTGLMPSQHGVHAWLDDSLSSRWPERWNAIGEFPTFPAILKEAGYATALIGKYHLGQPFHPQNAFDHWVTFPHGHTVDFYGNTMIDNGQQSVHDGHSVDYFTMKTIEFVKERRRNKEQPFFYFVPYNGPYGHWPAIKGVARNQFAPLYADADMHSAPREGLSPDVVARYALRVLESGGKPHERFAGPLLLPNDVPSLRNYYSQTTLIDDGVGQILATLQETGVADDTIVIYTSDHGSSLGHHGIWGHGLAAWPASAHRPSFNIPLIISAPGRWSGPRVVDSLARPLHAAVCWRREVPVGR